MRCPHADDRWCGICQEKCRWLERKAKRLWFQWWRRAEVGIAIFVLVEQTLLRLGRCPRCGAPRWRRHR